GRPSAGRSRGGEQPGTPSRRSVLRGAAGLAGAGLAASTAASVIATAPTMASSAARAAGTRTKRAPGPEGDPTEPVVVHVRDARSGEMDVFAGTTQSRLRDPELAARLTRAVR